MKTLLLTLTTFLLALVPAAPAQTTPHRAILQMNVGETDSWNQLLGNIQNIQKVFGVDKSQIQVVVYGKGLSCLLKTNQEFMERMKKASETGVVFAACQNSMRVRKVTTEDLVPFAAQVDSGVAEIIRKQEAGWSYVRIGE